MVVLGILVGLSLIVFAVFEAKKVKLRRDRAAASRQRLVEALSDPREAAAILLVQTALYGKGQVTLEGKLKITEQMQTHLGCSADEAEGYYSFGRMAIGQIGDALPSLGRILRPVHAHLTLDEMKTLVAMMMEVSAAEGSPDPAAVELIGETREALHVDLAMHLPD